MRVEDAQTLLHDNFAPWVLALKPRISALDQSGATLEIPITPDIARVGNIVCGQALATLADTSMVFACIGHLDAFQPVATTNLETRFLTAARGDLVRCEARVIRAGRALMFAEARLFSDPSGKEVAAASATFFVPPSSN
ncbi:PaaI family thioesterase [Thalassococcus lentus]|uniref:PaaI family thioesterase n=1 Tax=Thalassococcus lentus TaxID=1210524 RepID=A0ABT4XPQ7_9RHOB|nr:PaaI family thioesterase [Thalassococcus lentus]MDA7423890.1 PaaI family thioesterase [Thalassococcus lentus]